jgi:hypothetical protein
MISAVIRTAIDISRVPRRCRSVLKTRSGSVLSDQRYPVDGQEPPEVPGVALLLGDKQSKRRDVLTIARFGRVLLGVTEEVPALRTFPALEFLD